MNEEMAAKYMKKFKDPEMMILVNGEPGMLPVPEGWKSRMIQIEKESKKGKNQEKKFRKRSRADEGR